MINPAKQYFLDMETRVKIAEATVKDLSNVRVISDRGMLIDLYDRLGADAVCKGWRNRTDYAYEQRMAEWNLSHNPNFNTVLYQSKGKYRVLSSSAVRECMEEGKNPAEFLHPDALPILMDAERRMV